jgi:phospholipase/carboxylesterase
MNLLHTAYEPPGEGPHATVIALHGWGANGFDLLGLAPYLAGGQCLVLCPQGPVEVPIGPAVGYGWFPLSMGQPPDPGAFAAGVEDLRTFLAAAERRYPINPRKLALLGFSQGGVMAYALALAEPDRFAALVALSAWLPAPVAAALPPAARDSLPTFVQHGAQDDLIPVERARESVELLRRLGVPVAYREFDMGHEINPASLAALSEWLEQKMVSPIVLAR